MNELEWSTLIQVQTFCTIFNIVLMTNIIDRGFYILGAGLLFFFIEGSKLALAPQGTVELSENDASNF